MTRALTARQAGACEMATEKRCRCRCGGVLHGAGRVTADELEKLPEDDPHYVKAKPADDRLAAAGGSEWLAIGQLIPLPIPGGWRISPDTEPDLEGWDA
jgi:hypothetical protein